jgi:branched-chain amino acid transport system ATP-binding protein
MALVPEGRRVFSTLTVEENLQVGATVARRTDMRGRMAEMFARFPILEKYRARRAGTLSGGEQQQLVIARALLSGPKLLLLDEPSLGLAPLLVDQLFAILDEIRRSGVTVLVVEQNARRTLHLADRTYLARNGVIEECVEREELSNIEEGELEEKILGFTARR